jgi:Transglycosylase SLT domain
MFEMTSRGSRIFIGLVAAVAATAIVLALTGPHREGTKVLVAPAPSEVSSRLAICHAKGLALGTRPPRSVILSDSQAACLVQRSGFEPRSDNFQANHTVPTAAQLRAFRAVNFNPYRNRVTGDFTGTTDEILQWAAWKWGIGPNVLRAVAVEESYWRQDAVGDNGLSFGLMQVKRTAHPGTWPLSQQSTAFNVDYYGAMLRYYYDGLATWLGAGYGTGDLWGSVGAWFQGKWHTRPADGYAGGVRIHMGQQTWRLSDF